MYRPIAVNTASERTEKIEPALILENVFRIKKQEMAVQ
jgi:hypothetical protein